MFTDCTVNICAQEHDDMLAACLHSLVKFCSSLQQTEHRARHGMSQIIVYPFSMVLFILALLPDKYEIERLYGEIDRTGAQTMLYLTCTIISSVDLAHYGVSHAKHWVSVDCDTKISYPNE